MNAQYLLRFDDLCPTMDRARWRRFTPLLSRFHIKPILAVVPENRDPGLEIDPPDAGFWAQMQALQAAGASIGLHGYRHLCFAAGKSLIPLHRQTEFAGVAVDTQREWLRAGIAILRAHRLEPQIWVAPRHGLDERTLEALREQGLSVISDGFAEHPFRSHGLTWIPQQLWAPVEKQRGLWTICVHPNHATDAFVRELETFLERFADRFTSLDRVLLEWPARERSVWDKWFHARTLGRIRWRRLRASRG